MNQKAERAMEVNNEVIAVSEGILIEAHSLDEILSSIGDKATFNQVEKVRDQIRKIRNGTNDLDCVVEELEGEA